MVADTKTPDWLNRTEYPFRPNFHETPFGAMHFVDEGAGSPVVMVHGNPIWSFAFRNIIKLLRNRCRCIAPDHLGFGLSDKPLHWSYLPKDHAKNLETLLDKLDLEDITLVVGDWGGPIGLSYAIRNPKRVKNLVITNTWLWSVRNRLYYQAFSRFMGGFVGKFLIQHRNFFARDIVRIAFGDKSLLTPEIHNHYLMPFMNPAERLGSFVFPREILGSSDWLQSLWNAREVLTGKRMLLAWGMKDIAFKERELKEWMKAFPAARVVRYPSCGHFVVEEKAYELTSEILSLLNCG